MTIYLLFVGMPVYASLACHCVRMAEEHAHSCQAHGITADEAVQSHYSIPCCDDKHDSQSELYIPSLDWKDVCRCWAMDAAAPADFPTELNSPLPCVEWCLARVNTLLQTGCVVGSGLRGPPQM